MMWRCSISNAWNPRQKKSNNMHFSFVPNTHSQKEIAAEDREVPTYRTYLDCNRIATTVSFAQWIRNLLAKIIKCQSPTKSSPPCLQMHSVTNAAPNRMCKFIGHHQETCPCILFFYPVPVSTPFLQTKIGRMVFFAICIAINQYLVLISHTFI